MKIKAGKYSVCVKRLIRYGFTKEAAEITCTNIAITDANWVVKEKTKKENKFALKEPEEEVSKFETEVTGEELHVTATKRKKKLKTTAAGGKAVKREKGKERPIVSEPRAMQLPLFQPWRAFKSEHRLQTKLEKLVTAEEKFLTMEQLMKRAEYALAIKKKDAAPFIVYAIPEEVWDQATGMGKPLGTTKKGYPIVSWIKKGGQSIPMVMTEKGTMTEAEAVKSGAKAGGAGAGGPQISIGKILERRQAEGKGKVPISSPRTQAEVAAEKGREADKLVMGLKELTKKTLEIKTPQEKYREFRERQAQAEKPKLPPLTMQQKAEMETQQIEIDKIETSPSFKTIGANVQVQINFDELPEQDLWAHIVNDLNWTTEGINDEFKKIATMMGKSPFIYQEARNVLAQKESLGRIKNVNVLHDFIVHTKNHYLKKTAMERLKTVDKDFYDLAVAKRLSGPQATNRTKTRYGIDPRRYNTQKKEYDEAKIQKEKYLSQSYNKYFETDVPEKNIERLLKEERVTDQDYKASNPDGFSQSLEKMGLAQKGIIRTEPRAEPITIAKLGEHGKLKEEKKTHKIYSRGGKLATHQEASKFMEQVSKDIKKFRKKK